MEFLQMRLLSSEHGNLDIMLRSDSGGSPWDLPNGKEFVYNDNAYVFAISDAYGIPTSLSVNDEAYDVELCGDGYGSHGFQRFRLKGSDTPFWGSFGAIRIEVEVGERHFFSQSIAVMVSSNDTGNSVMNMVRYIYEHCGEYLFGGRECRGRAGESFEAKIEFLQKALRAYGGAYPDFKMRPHSKIAKTEGVETFDKLQTVSPKAIRYILNHVYELSPVAYDTGIAYNKQYYQPNRVLAEHGSYSLDTYENRAVLGFLKTLLYDIGSTLKTLRGFEYARDEQPVGDDGGYFDSMYQIISGSMEKIKGYIEILGELQAEYRKMYYFYSRIFGIEADFVKSLPAFTPVFRSVNAYRQIYAVMRGWFPARDYGLGKEELMLSLISTSRIYEYYCLIKMLRHLDIHAGMAWKEARSASYAIRNRYYADTGHNNTFVFSDDDRELTLYFQPVIFGDGLDTNGIGLFRNTSLSVKKESDDSEDARKGKFYMPDYLIKAEQGGRAEYLILDAKFSSTRNIRSQQVEDMVYKYLFSISAMNPSDSILGLYILCGKDTWRSDGEDTVHDFAERIGRKVRPFAEILVMNGVDTEDYRMPAIIFGTLEN